MSIFSPKNLTYTLIAGYRADLRLKIIDRWMDLEAQTQAATHATPQTMAEALMKRGVVSENETGRVASSDPSHTHSS